MIGFVLKTTRQATLGQEEMEADLKSAFSSARACERL
jgi:hypothetical protein